MDLLAYHEPETLLAVAHAFASVAFLWLPIVFAAYAIGRKRFGLRLVFAAVTAEAFALFVFYNLCLEFFISD
ncbi:MAG TPA: hypothetical protein VGG64_21120 [Pirellulales bacterium]|jgi:hypothetical protein